MCEGLGYNGKQVIMQLQWHTIALSETGSALGIQRPSNKHKLESGNDFKAET